MALVAYGSSDEGSESSDVETEVRGTVGQDLQVISRTATVHEPEADLEDIVIPSENELALRQKISRKRKPVQIHLPSINQVDSDSDEDFSSKPDEKKAKVSSGSGRCGLFSMLPPPIATTKLVPPKVVKNVTSHVLVSKTAAVASTAVPQSTLAVRDTSVCSDDEDIGITSNFFEIENATRCKLSAPLPYMFSSEANKTANLDSSEGSQKLWEVPEVKVEDNYSNTADDEVQSAESYSNEHCSPVVENLEYGDDERSAESSSTFENYLQDQQFLRLYGRKHNANQAINIIDVHADDQLRDVDLTKSISEEVSTVMSHSKKRNKDLPSSQQKRKHQITYLAYKAKERELELKNQWAENRFNKRQTQSKYGF